MLIASRVRHRFRTLGARCGNGKVNSFTTVQQAVTDATDGSHLFFLPGTYSLDTGPLVVRKPLKGFCNIGTAVIRPR